MKYSSRTASLKLHFLCSSANFTILNSSYQYRLIHSYTSERHASLRTNEHSHNISTSIPYTFQLLLTLRPTPRLNIPQRIN